MFYARLEEKERIVMLLAKNKRKNRLKKVEIQGDRCLETIGSSDGS